MILSDTASRSTIERKLLECAFQFTMKSKTRQVCKVKDQAKWMYSLLLHVDLINSLEVMRVKSG